MLLVGPQQELNVAVRLMTRTVGCLPYVPCYADRRQVSDGMRSGKRAYRMVTTQRPLFAGYVFARFDLSRRAELLTDIPGVMDILRFGNEPAIVTDEEMAFLRTLEDAKATPADFKPGDMVEIMEGAFRGKRGRYEGDKKDALVIALENLGRAVRIQIDRSEVKAA